MWAFDFQFDVTQDGRAVKLLHVVDEFTREALAMEAERRIGADRVVDVLDRIDRDRGRHPQFVRCDNGPEMTSNAAARLVPVPPDRRGVRRGTAHRLVMNNSGDGVGLVSLTTRGQNGCDERDVSRAASANIYRFRIAATDWSRVPGQLGFILY